MSTRVHSAPHGHEAQGSPGDVPQGLAQGSIAENRIFGFWVFLGGEATLFATLIGVFLALQNRNVGGPSAQELFNLPLVGFATVTLLTSSLRGTFATQAGREGDIRRMQRWLAVTAVLGEIFLGVQAYEFWGYMSGEGLSLSTSAFASGFYALVGFHGLHVTFGVYWLLSFLFNSFLSERVTREDAAHLYVAGLYWHFVDVVWVVIFSLVYLMGKLG